MVVALRRTREAEVEAVGENEGVHGGEAHEGGVHEEVYEEVHEEVDDEGGEEGEDEVAGADTSGSYERHRHVKTSQVDHRDEIASRIYSVDHQNASPLQTRVHHRDY